MPPATSTTPTLQRLRPDERAEVLTILLRRHPELRAEAEAASLRLVRRVDPDAVAAHVVAQLEHLDLDDLAGRVGRVPGGYVHETEAASELVDDAIDSVRDDLRRHIALGLTDEAARTLLGLVDGLHRCLDAPDGSVLAYAGPDTPLELAAWEVDRARRDGVEPDADELETRCPSWGLTPDGLRAM
jgi:hypothetical protein